MDAFETLGLTREATQEEVHKAYRELVKAWHPDRFPLESDEQKHAQEKLVELNLAYEEAVRLSGTRDSTPLKLRCEEAVRFAGELYQKGNYAGALMKLQHAEGRSAEWYACEGKVLLALKQYSTAHQAYREAVRMDPDNSVYREGALEAALQMKKHRKLVYRVGDWVDGVLHPRK